MARNRLSPSRISVIMPVYNLEAFVTEAIISILSQTEHYFELIVIDDASTDTTYEKVNKFRTSDNRITLYQNPIHLGVAATANRCIAKASGTLLARMDGDDIALPDRLEKQRAFLEQHPDIIAVGGQFFIIDEKNNIQGQRFFPTQHQDIYRQTFTFTALSQPGLMMNRSLLPENFLFYNEHLSTAEETELVFKLFHYGNVANLPDTILKYRVHKKNTSLVHPKKTFFITLSARIAAVLFEAYIPTLSGIFMNLAQLLVVLLLPKQLVLALYARMRNQKQENVQSIAVELS